MKKQGSFKSLVLVIAMCIASVVILSSCESREHRLARMESHNGVEFISSRTIKSVSDSLIKAFNEQKIYSVTIYYYISGEKVMTGQFSCIGEFKAVQRTANKVAEKQANFNYVDSVGIYIDELPRMEIIK